MEETNKILVEKDHYYTMDNRISQMHSRTGSPINSLYDLEQNNDYNPNLKLLHQMTSSIDRRSKITDHLEIIQDDESSSNNSMIKIEDNVISNTKRKTAIPTVSLQLTPKMNPMNDEPKHDPMLNEAI